METQRPSSLGVVAVIFLIVYAASTITTTEATTSTTEATTSTTEATTSTTEATTTTTEATTTTTEATSTTTEAATSTTEAATTSTEAAATTSASETSTVTSQTTTPVQYSCYNGNCLNESLSSCVADLTNSATACEGAYCKMVAYVNSTVYELTLSCDSSCTSSSSKPNYVACCASHNCSQLLTPWILDESGACGLHSSAIFLSLMFTSFLFVDVIVSQFK